MQLLRIFVSSLITPSQGTTKRSRTLPKFSKPIPNTNYQSVPTFSNIEILTFILVNGNNPSHRHMATVLLKRNLINLYATLEANEKEEFKSFLLHQYSK